MSVINIVGLGPGSIDSLTLDAVKKIHDKNPNFIRTREHPTIEYFDNEKIDYKSYDYIYENQESFDSVYNEIVDDLIEKASEFGEINYFVPGNPMVAERTVTKLLFRRSDDLIVNLGTGLSFIEPMLELVGHDPINGLCLLDAIDFSIKDIQIGLDCIITQVYNNRVASDLKLVLSEVYGDEYKVYLINAGGIKEFEEVHFIPIYELDRIEGIGNLTSVFVPKVKEKDEIYGMSDIIHTMERLRGPDGCPWDREQTHKKLRRYVVEEAYELVDAIDNRDIDNIIEELGDVLLQVIFHSQIGLESGEFNIYDVVSRLNKKLIYRHPHVFSDKTVENSEEVIYNWDKLKLREKKIQTVTDNLKDIPSQSLLMKSYKLQKRAASVGFDWEDIEGPLSKVIEEYNEVLELVNKTEGGDASRIEEEIGDLFFSVVNLSRFLGVDPDIALNRTINKFISRFEFIEKKALEKGENLEDLSLEEMDSLWNEAKKKEN